MPKKFSFRKWWKEEREKLSEMSFKKAVKYIWQYYWIFILGFIGIIWLAVFAVNRFLTGTPEESTLYFPIRLENRDAVQKAMAAKNVYCPVIWPEPAEAAGVCPVSRAVVDDMLAIPCDQRYDEADMDYISGCLTEILRGC